jgi:hypothetical protein
MSNKILEWLLRRREPKVCRRPDLSDLTDVVPGLELDPEPALPVSPLVDVDMSDLLGPGEEETFPVLAGAPLVDLDLSDLVDLDQGRPTPLPVAPPLGDPDLSDFGPTWTLVEVGFAPGWLPDDPRERRYKICQASSLRPDEEPLGFYDTSEEALEAVSSLKGVGFVMDS